MRRRRIRWLRWRLAQKVLGIPITVKGNPTPLQRRRVVAGLKPAVNARTLQLAATIRELRLDGRLGRPPASPAFGKVRIAVWRLLHDVADDLDAALDQAWR